MPLFGKRKAEPQYVPEASPALGPADLADASKLMDTWDACLGNSDATWECIEMIARRGGFRGEQQIFQDVARGADTRDVLQRPWRWWRQAALLANQTGDDVLAGRIFLFTHLFVVSMLPKMTAFDQGETGLCQPSTESYHDIARVAVQSLARLAPSLLIHDTATGKVDVHNALRMAEEVSGVRAQRPSGEQAGGSGVQEFNSY